jgi:hypothetical protein
LVAGRYRLEARIAAGGGQDPGTVLSVQPSGRVPAGSVIVVTAVSQQDRGGQGHGHGDGQGNGNGGGGD